MRILLSLLVLVLLVLQYQLWVGRGSLAETRQLQQRITVQLEENARLAEENDALYTEISALREGGEAIEEHARTRLGMIKEGETFIMIVDDAPDNNEESRSD